MRRLFQRFMKKTTVILLLLAVSAVICACQKTSNPSDTSGEHASVFGENVRDQLQKNPAYADYDAEPFVIRTVLREYTVINPETKAGAYGRYTELLVEGNAPDTFRDAISACNARAEESVKTRADQIMTKKPASGAKRDSYQYVTLGYIAAVTRADKTAFSLLETEFEKGSSNSSSDISYRFTGSTYDTASGQEIGLSDLIDENACSGLLKAALSTRYGIADLADTSPSSFAWTADALGIRFYFNSDAVSPDKRREIKDYSARAITTGLSYAELTGPKAEALASVPDAYIAMLEREKTYDLPGGLSVRLTQQEDQFLCRILKDNGETEDLIIEYADDKSDYYIIRSEGDFYLYRERIGYQEGFFYDFSRPDGGFGRFAYHGSEYFDSFLREISLALAYNPNCVHMAEVSRSFGESSYDDSSFIPHGHYAFPGDPDARYKRFVLTDSSLQIDTNNVACRLLEDLTVAEIDDDGNEIGQITVPAGMSLFFESVTGEAQRYNVPPMQNYYTPDVYDCRLADGRRIRFVSTTESTLAIESVGYMNRFTEPVSLAEAQESSAPEEIKPYTVQIAGKTYPLIPDYFQKDHQGEVINFGSDLWWQVEGYPGQYISTEEDQTDMQADSLPAQTGQLTISDDGTVVFDYDGHTFSGSLPEKRYYRNYVTIDMTSDTAQRSFKVILREGSYHDAPTKIQFYSPGEPATNVPSTVLPITVYMTRISE